MYLISFRKVFYRIPELHNVFIYRILFDHIQSPPLEETRLRAGQMASWQPLLGHLAARLAQKCGQQTVGKASYAMNG
jgi:hypothetical protein